METIWKYNIDTIDRQTIQMPRNAEILTVQTQNGSPCLWVRVNTSSPDEIRKIEICGTGRELPKSSWSYIGTYEIAGDALGYHVFEIKGE